MMGTNIMHWSEIVWMVFVVILTFSNLRQRREIRKSKGEISGLKDVSN
ncbi:hypothetical protein LCGC14_0969330 [marine sediment metagenome]|uniref:Uncharacterized protein n=1 Tax=marine sediment metagenome TaxID=412755 RepID=A0A0F9QVB6_9ZZZZ